MLLCFFRFLTACFVQFVTFSLSVPVQLIAWEDSPSNDTLRNDTLRVEWEVKLY